MFAEKLVNILQERGITAYRMSKDTKIAEALIGQYKQGKKKPSYEKVLIIAQYLGVSTDYLLGNTPLESDSDLSDSSYNTDDVNINEQKETADGVTNYGDLHFEGCNGTLLGVGKVTGNEIEEELVIEMTKVLKRLSLKDRSELITMVYKFENEHSDKD